ncbi:hypothetical protein N7533_009456 [Penicillium manginii]|uniref:uncharacterized protein n=1 Tax=Penicillium manginii TaxID=203109 RepID=UPI0025473090|nr:uncharacterized protein N7533_009456 [Penicillium manginii]KAJ5744586.1 hypothetical protein N7533_009456 [Penicillium manginii]
MASPMELTVHHQGTAHNFSLSASATLQDLSATIEASLNIPTANQKLLIAPKPGMQKAPFPPTRLDTILQLSSPKFKITLLGTPAQAIADLNTQAETNRRHEEARASALASARRNKKTPTRSNNTIATLSSSSKSYTFHKLLPLSYLPRPERSLDFLKRLRDDPGIRAAMGVSRTPGLNRNRGEVIELRLRTDAYDGYRDYRTIRKTLCHELAHNVFGDHDRDFWNLTAQIEREVEAADTSAGGRRLTQQEFYNPGDWEQAQGEEEVDECGWTGGEFVLGGSSGSSASASGESRREAIARAAEERLKKERRDEEAS